MSEIEEPVAERPAMPARYVVPWTEVSERANRRRLSVAVFIRPETSLVDDGTTLRGTFDLLLTERSGADTKLGVAKTFEEAIEKLDQAIADRPLPGPDALREELREHGRLLGRLTPRSIPKRGGDFPLYRHFRDVVLPLAWDNLVESVRVEALEEFVRKVGESDRGTAKGARNTLAALVEESRALVAPKEESDGAPSD